MIKINYIKIKSVCNGVEISTFYNLKRILEYSIIQERRKKYLTCIRSQEFFSICNDRKSRPKEAELRKYMDIEYGHN